jgi:hypothetical protein
LNPFDLHQLIWPIFLIFSLTLFITFHVTKNLSIAAISAIIKSGIFTIYFNWCFDGAYTFLDDWGYLDGGRKLLSENVGILNLFENWNYVLKIGRGNHFVYYLYNAYAFRIFGNEYFAPVALNIILSIFIALTGAKLAAREFGFSRLSIRLLYLFLLFHPDILAWSNVLNLKDVLVLLLHIILLYAVSLFYRKKRFSVFLVGVSACLILFFLRFYVPLLFCAALCIGILTNRRLFLCRRIRLLFVGSCLLVLVFLWAGTDKIGYALYRINGNIVNPIYGFIRIILTPIPFHTEPAYGFLNLPALFHWLLIPAAVLGFIRIYRLHTPFSTFFIAYFFMFIGLYALCDELQGPRHRVQLDYAFAIFQFIGLTIIWRSIYRPLYFKSRWYNKPSLTVSKPYPNF